MFSKLLTSPLQVQARVVGTVSAAAFLGSLLLQHVFGFEPCSTCILQRLGFLALLLVTVPFTLPGVGQRAPRVFQWLIGAGSLAGIGVAVFHGVLLTGWLDASCSLSIKFFLMDLQAVLPSFASYVLDGQGSCTPEPGVFDITAPLVGASFMLYCFGLTVALKGLSEEERTAGCS